MPTAALCAAAIFLVMLSPLLLLASAGAPGAGTPVLVVAPPWGASAAEIIARSGLQEVAPERAPLGALTVLSRNEDAGRLRRNGAWFVVDGERVAELCTQ